MDELYFSSPLNYLLILSQIGRETSVRVLTFVTYVNNKFILH
jgi:hypothetical protein